MRKAVNQGRHNPYRDALAARHMDRDVRTNGTNEGNFWVTPIHTVDNEIADNSGFSLDQEVTGIAVGGGFRPTANTNFGLMAGYTEDDLDGTNASGDGDAYSYGIYADYSPGSWLFSFGLLYSSLDYDIDRDVFDSSNSSSFSGDGMSIELEVSNTISNGMAYFRPSVALIHETVDLDDAEESGEFGTLESDGTDADRTSVRVGIDVSRPVQTERMTAFVPYAGLSYEAAIADSDPSTRIGFVNDEDENTARVSGDSIDDPGVGIKLGAHAQFTSNFGARVEYNHQDGNQVSGSLNWRF